MGGEPASRVAASLQSVLCPYATTLNQWLLASLDRLNPAVTSVPFRLFEICDQSIYPPFLRRRCQDMLTAEWTHRLPVIQRRSPADLAADLIVKALDAMADDGADTTVVDFCSGSGGAKHAAHHALCRAYQANPGPVPAIEKLVNGRRTARNKPPITFQMTDIKPHIEAWMAACSHSSNIGYFPSPVDAANPPAALVEISPHVRVFRLYCLAFHHFPDDLAHRVLLSSISSSDGFAIIELQDRRVTSLLLIFLDLWLMLGVTVFWFRYDLVQLFFTYVVPLLPLTLCFDGFVSCLRTRTFLEVMTLIDTRLDSGPYRSQGMAGSKALWQTGAADVEGWVFTGGRQMHTWPIGYMNYILGRRVERRFLTAKERTFQSGCTATPLTG